ncbi:MAG TPA: efflux RND transporter periplasmic adaptor subunit [Hyphomonadaceae bacterium]|jgi:HlyD family secretion protein
MNKKLLVGIAGAAIVVVGAIAMFARGGGNPTTGKYEFETAAVERGDVARVISASGAVQPRNKVDVGSEVSGKIVELMVDFNSPVKKGQVLAQIDPETFRTQVNSAYAALLQSQASVANAKSAILRAEANLVKATQDYERQKKLFAEGAISQSAWEQADQQYTIAKIALETEKASKQSADAGLARSQASLEEARLRLDRTKILSPIDGVILSRKVEVGQTVQSSQQVAQFFTIAQDLSEIQIEAAVVESDIGGIDDGDPVTFTVDAFPGERFQGRVVQVRQQGAEQANVVTYTVVVQARNQNGKLKPGMTANAEITADRASDVLRIAYDATRFQPPKEILEAMGGPNGGEGGGQRGPGGQGGGGFQGGGQGGPQVANFPGGGQGAQGGNRGGGGGSRGGPGGGFGPGGNNPMGEWLTAAGVDQARSQKIMSEMQAEMERVRASVMPQQQQQGAIIGGGGGGFGPPPSIVQQQQMQEMRAKMEQTRESVLRRNLSPDEYAEVEKHRVEMQSQKRVTVYKVNDKGELERHMLMIGISDGNFAQVVRGAEEGDKFVVRATAAGKGEKK